MTQFETLPLSAAQADDEPVDPGFLVPDYNTVIPPFDEDIDPDFSVMPPIYPDRPYPPDRPFPDRPIYPPFIPTPMPCLFCNNNQWARGSIRFLNAATGYNAFTIYIDTSRSRRDITDSRSLPTAILISRNPFTSETAWQPSQSSIQTPVWT